MFKIIGNISNLPSLDRLGISDHDLQNQTVSDYALSRRIGEQQKMISILASNNKINTSSATIGEFNKHSSKRVRDDVVNHLSTLLRIEKPSATVSVVWPGGLTMHRIVDALDDYLTQSPNSELTTSDVDSLRLSSRLFANYTVMLDAWQYGQGIVYMDKVLSHWNAGDIIYSDWHRVPQSMFNTGFWPLSTVNVQGIHSRSSESVLDLALFGIKIRVDYNA